MTWLITIVRHLSMSRGMRRRWLLGGSAIALMSGGLMPAALALEPELGWEDWQREIQTMEDPVEAGFSTPELRQLNAFEQSCQRSQAATNRPVERWFRVSTVVNQIGTGLVEYGCVQDGLLLHRTTLTAIASGEPVTCLQVSSPVSNGLNVRAWPGDTEQIVGGVVNGTQVDPGSVPATITEVDGRNWVAIVSPVTGWISHGPLGSAGNLIQCPRPEDAISLPMDGIGE
jgi:hypothetical protein